MTGVVTGVVTLSDLNRGVRDPRAVKKNCTEGCKRDFVLPVQSEEKQTHRESVCCLLVLDSVTSTPQRIRHRVSSPHVDQRAERPSRFRLVTTRYGSPGGRKTGWCEKWARRD